MSFNIFEWNYREANTYPREFNVTETLKKNSHLKIDLWDRSIEYKGKEELSIQADKPINQNTDQVREFYFEVQIKNMTDKNAMIAVGISQKGFPESKELPGWLKGSFGYHSDDGSFYSEDGKQGLKFGPPVKQNQTVGCGINNAGELYFTVDGEKVNGSLPKIPNGEYFPTVGLCGPISINYNFGASNFVYKHPFYNKMAESQEFDARFAYRERYLTHILTDKPIYRPGDVMYFRGFLLHALSQTPINDIVAAALFSPSMVNGKIKIISPSDSEVFSTNIERPINSTLAGCWSIPSDSAGGDYKLKIEYSIEGFPASEREFNIREFSNPRLKLQMEFPKKGYGPGDEVVANLDVSRAEGGIPQKANVTATARIDGTEVYRGNYKLSGDGKCEVRFNLPTKIDVGEGTLTCTVDDEGTIESTGKTIPILMQNLKMEVYPEGGYLVSGLPARIYVEAFTPTDDPADFTGEIIDDLGSSVGAISTVHEGRGTGEFRPVFGRKYSIRVLVPSSVVSLKQLPEVQQSGICMKSLKSVYLPSESIQIEVGATSAGMYQLGIYKRDQELTKVAFEIPEDNGLVTINAPIGSNSVSDGVLRATVFDTNGIARAERLIFRKPSGKLSLTIETDKEKYTPGETVKLRVKAYDEQNLPVSAIVGICVTDDTVLEMVEKRKQTPRLPLMTYFENEVAHLEDAHVYLDGNDPISETAVDLLLGTQGWRRFAFDKIQEFVANSKDADNKSLFRAKNIDQAERVLGIHKEAPNRSRAHPPPPLPSLINYRGIPGLPPPPGRGAPPLGGGPPPAPALLLRRTAVPVESALPLSSAPAPPPALSASVSRPQKEEKAKKKMAPQQSILSSLVPKAASAKKKKIMMPRRRLSSSDEDDFTIKPTTVSFPTRIYAHKHTKSTDGSRSDFTETIFWNAGVVTSDITPNLFSCTFDNARAGVSSKLTATNAVHTSKTGDWQTWITDRAIPKTGVHTWKVRINCDDTSQSINCQIGIADNESAKVNEAMGSCDSYYWSVADTQSTVHATRSYINTSYGVPFARGSEITVVLDWNKETLSFGANGTDYGVAIRSIRNSDKWRFAVSGYRGITAEISTGEPSYQFDLNDSITSFKIWVDGVSRVKGYVASAQKLITSTNPFYMEYKLPIEVTSNDNIIIPVSLVNETDSSFDIKLFQKASDEEKALQFTQASKRSKPDSFAELDVKKIKLAKGERGRLNVTSKVLFANMISSITLKATGDTFEDIVTRNTRIVPFGFPYKLCAAGIIAKDTIYTTKFVLPKELDISSITTELTFYLSPVGNMEKSLESLIREPYGCFEQTSSTAYPMVMAQQYLLSHRETDPAIIDKAKKHILSSYKKLTSYESKDRAGCRTGGFEWFGGNPANESLTAYGLLEFNDMSQVHPVEKDLIPRIHKWLFSRRDGSGAFLRNRGKYGFGSAPEEITNAYICWALTESGTKGPELDKEIEKLITQAESTKKYDPYFLSLVACTLFNIGRNDEGSRYAYLLTELQNEDGSVVGDNKPLLHDTRFTTITYSWGNGLIISTTSIAILAWLRGGDEFAQFYEKGIQFIYSKCKGGSFGDTQSTILSLKAIVEYDKKKSRPAPGSVSVLIDGKDVSSLQFDPSKSSATLSLPSFAGSLSSGEHTLEIKMKDGANIPFSLAIDYFSSLPDNDPDCSVKLETKLSSNVIPEGEGSEIFVSMINKENQPQPMTIAIIGLPGGLEPRHEQLRELVKSGTIAYYEVLGREVAIYVREMGPSQIINFKIDVVARLPGTYTGQASRIYLYYTNESKHWNPPFSVTITPSDN